MNKSDNGMKTVEPQAAQKATKKVAAETYGEFMRRIKYGTQLVEIISRRGEATETLQRSTTRGIRSILRNVSLPTVVSEKKLMVKLGYLPAMMAIRDNKVSGVFYYTQYALLNALLLEHGMTANELIERSTKLGNRMESSVYKVLRGYKMTYEAFNRILQIMGYKLDVVLIPATAERFNQYVESLKVVYREQGVYEVGVEILLNAPKSTWLMEGEVTDAEFRPKKKLSHEEILESLKRIEFRDSDRDSIAAVLNREELATQAGFLKFSLTGLEMMAELMGKSVKYKVSFDFDFESRAKRGAKSAVVTGYKRAIEFIGAATYGDGWDTLMSNPFMDAYKGKKQLRLAGLIKLLEYYNARVEIRF